MAPTTTNEAHRHRVRVHLLGKPDELEKLSNNNSLEPEKRLNENKFRASWYWVTAIGLFLFAAGFFIGLVLMGDPDFRLTGFITLAVIIFVLSRARRELLKYESAYIDTLRESRDEEMKLLAKRQQVATLEAKKYNAAKSVAKELNKTEGQNNASLTFTSNDFDDAAQALLLKPVREARKKKVRVTGQGLIETILKGFH